MKKSSIFLLGGFIVIFILGLVYRFWEDQREDKLLQRTKNIIAILTIIRDGKGVHDSATGTYKYFVNGRKYECEENRNFNDLSIGDTVLIEYAIADPSVARVIDKYYMQKYKHLKK